jgi:hypothetical protein
MGLEVLISQAGVLCDPLEFISLENLGCMIANRVANWMMQFQCSNLP